jgi:hypothetical protein
LFRLARSFAAAAVAAALVIAPAASANEAGTTASDARSASFSSENVEWVNVLPQHSGTSGGALLGKHYYVTDPRGVFIYNVAEPASPDLVGQLLAPQSQTHALLAQEDPETNGKILLVNALHPDAASNGAAPNGWLLIVDVKDKSAPKVLSSLNVYDHTWSCILKCTYAIGRTGYIVDLRNPAKPKVVGDWRKHVQAPDYMHDFTEVAPGRLIGAGQPSFYLDMRNPLKPKELTRFDPGFHTLGYHGAAWPNNGKDPLLLMGAEVAPSANGGLVGSDCTDKGVHAVATYDARAVVKADRKRLAPARRRGISFRKLQEWRVAGSGVYADGNAPGHTLYCGHWFDPHPKWKAGGLLALGHYDWGTRFLKVSRNGKMKEVGWFQPVQGHTASARWISKDIVYVHDYRRGLEILRFKS